MPRYDLDGQVAVVTGGARGIGREICLRLAAEGARVVVVDRDDPGEVTNEILAAGGVAISIQADVTRRSDVDAAVAAALSHFGRLDVLVNNAGVLRATPVLEIDDQEWALHMAVNARAVLYAAQAAVPVMLAQGRGGRIIVVVSSAGRLPSTATLGSYVASKHAAMGLVQQLGLELAPLGILTNAVFPGIVDTPMLESVHRARAAQEGLSYQEVREREINGIPLGRLQQPSDVAGVVAFLASTDAAYTTGQAFDVGGGAFFW